MQFFHLFSFVVVASYAAALPQPAGLSEKYSNNVDTTLASILEARSYQPVSNSYKDSATLVSLKRRDDSGGSPEDNSGSDSSPPPDTTPDEPFIDPFADGTLIFKNIASTINNVGDGVVGLFKKGELAIQKFDGDARDMVARHLRRHAYVNAALAIWSYFRVASVFNFIKSLWSDDELSVVGPELVAKIEELKVKFNAESKAAVDATTKISNDDGLATDNLHDTNTSFQNALFTCISLVDKLRSQLVEFNDGETLSEYLADIIVSISDFHYEQQEFYAKIAKKLGVPSFRL
ncbi:hypothetical protein BASA83_002031 [Batrachochytrium salamandrivorans]|nr:hypothetical protein BASA83_002031 [Batrachochytrium salamandrivorans]